MSADPNHPYQHGQEEGEDQIYDEAAPGADDEGYLDPNDYEIVEEDQLDGDAPMDEEDDDEDEDVMGGGEEDEQMREDVIEDNSLGHAGGEDDLAYLFCPIPDTFSSKADPAVAGFNNSTFSPIKLTGHTDSVVCTEFSTDGEYVATGGMDGKVRIWRRVKQGGAVSSDASASTSIAAWQNWEFLTTLTTDDEVTWLAWHPRGPVLAAGCNDSTIWMWQLPSGKTMQVFSSHTDTCTSGKFTPNGKMLITTSADSTTCVWDPREATPMIKLAPQATTNYGNFEGGITALAVAPGSNLFAIGGADGTVKVVNLPNGHVVNTLSGHAEEESIEGLEFMDILGLAGEGSNSTKGLLLVSGGTDGKAIIWDVTNGNARAEVQHNEPVTGLSTHPLPHRHLFTTSSADKTLKTWDARTGALLANHTAHGAVVNAVRVGRAPAGWGVLEDEQDKTADAVISAGDDGIVASWRV